MFQIWRWENGAGGAMNGVRPGPAPETKAGRQADALQLIDYNN